MSIKYDKYMPLYTYLSPASIPQIVAHIQDYLVKHPILSVETIAEIIVQSLQEHPELINGTAIPISADSEQSIKAYIDSLPSIDTYTKAEINALLTGKQDTLTFDQAPTPGSSNPVTSSGIIAAMSAMNEALETLINGKADSASTYTKSQVDTLLTDKANADDVYSKNTMDAKLLEYATSESVYSKQDINTMKQVNKANLAIVSTDGLAPLDIAAGQYVYFNDVMYMATEEILTGAQLVPNANIVINPIGVTNRIGDGLKNAVTQINGLAGRMTLAEEELNSQSQQIEDLQAAAAYVEDGDNATQKTYAEGEYIVWKGSLYTVNSGDIPLNTAIAGHVTAVTGGGFNAVSGAINTVANKILGDVKIITGINKRYFRMTVPTADQYGILFVCGRNGSGLFRINQTVTNVEGSVYNLVKTDNTYEIDFELEYAHWFVIVTGDILKGVFTVS